MRSIIHFTSKFSTLQAIIQTSSLALSYCKEDFYLGHKKISRAAHPMICFSEYDISDLSSRTITYGRYGIAFRKDWALSKKIHPVIYIDPNSTVAYSLATLLRARQSEVSLPSNLRLPIITIKCFVKNSVGYNPFTKEENFVFSDEREWRFVPLKKEIGNGLISQNRRTYLKKKRILQ